MLSGFLDLTYQFRHYALIESGSGFVAGESKTKLTTYIYSASERTVNAILGHDDEVLVQANGHLSSNLPNELVSVLPLSVFLFVTGWNKLDLVLSNDENINWRWSGISLALRRGTESRSAALDFPPTPPSGSSALASTTGTLT